MAAGSDEVVFSGRSIRMKGPLPVAQMQLLRAEVREGLSRITEIDVEFLSTSLDSDLAGVLGRPLHVEIDTEGEGIRYFSGHCVEVLFEGVYEGQGHYLASLRSWQWFMTQTTDSRIFQDKTAMEIIKQIFGEYGFADFEDKTGGGGPQRPYCVQYRETDYDFIHRLMVEEGFYYYMDYTDLKDTMVIVNDIGLHRNIAERHELDFFFKEDMVRLREDHIFDWRERETLRTGKVTLNDYHFVTPSSDLKVTTAIPKGTHSRTDFEVYDHPGRYTETERGTALSRTRQEAFAAEHLTSRGIGNCRTLAVGYRFTLKNHPRTAANREYLITEAIHQLQIETEYNLGELEETALGERVTLDPKKNPDPYRCTFRCQPATERYRHPHPCPRPKIPGLQTAMVVGPAGEEIHTDCYGRVKVQFHWDREAKAADRKENSSCWIRKAEPWSGKGWGMQWIPRIGQEVVVQFEEGDPDRPMVVGMLFNNATTHPPFRKYDLSAPTMTTTDPGGVSVSSGLAATMNLMGWTTRSTKQGGTTTFHEFVFDDTKDAEFVRFQSERDYKEIIKNNAEVTVGIEHQNPGDFTMTVHNHHSETVKQGDRTIAVETGKETHTVKGDRSVTVEGKHDESVTGDQTVTLSAKQTVSATSDISIKSNSKITLTVGSNSITIDTTGITVSGGMVSVEGTGTAEMKSPATTVDGSGTLMLTGGVVKIN